jgi:hypothetical protein
VIFYNSRGRKFVPPASGSKALLFSNSKGDTAGGLGQWFDTICNTNGWIPQNRNQISNGGFERTGTAGWQGLSPGGTIARVTGAGNTHNGSAGAGQLFYSGATPASVFASPYNPSANTWGVDTSPDTNGMRLGMVGGMTYTFSAWMMTPGSGASQAEQFLRRRVHADRCGFVCPDQRQLRRQRRGIPPIERHIRGASGSHGGVRARVLRRHQRDGIRPLRRLPA